MKPLFSSRIGLVCLSLLVTSPSFADVDSKLTIAKIKNVFVPFGFDDNDEVVAVLDGYLPDTCYKIADTEVKREGNTITITQKARLYAGNCFDVTVPFVRVVRLGIVEKGDYTVLANGGATKSPLHVEAATKAGPDDYLYAPVDQARVVGQMAILGGRFTNNCLKITDIKANHTNATVQVLPIMKLQSATEAGHDCEAGEFPFETSVGLSDLKLDAGRHLLHVRSLDGQSVNTVFTQN